MNKYVILQKEYRKKYIKHKAILTKLDKNIYSKLTIALNLNINIISLNHYMLHK